MEVSHRHLPRPRVAAGALEAARTSLALGATLAVALVAALLQPLDAPWWVYADADATYVASGLNLVRGERTQYLDHPGLPLQELVAVAAEVDHLAGRIAGSDESRSEYARAQILRLESWRPLYRTFAVAFYLLGAAVAYAACSRLLGHRGLGVAGGLLWVGAPGLVPMSIQYRSDVPLAALALLIAFLVAAGAQRRDARLYTLAALALGFAATVKIHAVGLLPALAAAVALRPPTGDPARLVAEEARVRVRRHAVALSLAAAVWAALAVAFNRGSFPPDVTAEQRTLLTVAAAAFGAYLVALATVPRVRGLLDPFTAVLGGALALGVALPATLFVGDGLQMLVAMKESLLGRGVNEGIEPFVLASDTSFAEWPLRQGVAVFALAGISAAVALRRRTVWPALLFLGALVLGAMATARLGAVHYFAPAYVVSVPAALWLFRRSRLGALAAAVLVAYVVVPQVVHLDDARERAQHEVATAEELSALAGAVVTEGRVALVDLAAPTPDSRYNGLVENFVANPPPLPGRRFLEDYPRSLDRARADGLVFSHYVGRRALEVSREQELAFSFATYRVRPLHELARPDLGIGVLEFVAGPGVDRPYDHPDARYDPETGYFRDPSGAFYDLLGNPVADPPRRRPLGDGLWVDAYGDVWNERGELVRSDPTLRTAP